MTALTDDDRDDLYANELALDNLQSNWGRAALEATVESLIARHVQAALTEAAEQIEAEALLWSRDVNRRALAAAARIVRARST